MLYPKAKHKKHKTNLETKLFLKCGVQFFKQNLNFALNVVLKKFIIKAIKNYLSKKTFFLLRGGGGFKN